MKVDVCFFFLPALNDLGIGVHLLPIVMSTKFCHIYAANLCEVFSKNSTRNENIMESKLRDHDAFYIEAGNKTNVNLYILRFLNSRYPQMRQIYQSQMAKIYTKN